MSLLSRCSLLLLLVLHLDSSRARAQQAPAQPATAAQDAKLRTLYTDDFHWRVRMRDDEEDDETAARLRPLLPRVDRASQQEREQHEATLLAQLQTIDAAHLSDAERINFEVFRAQILTLLNAQRFREYEMPVNSDTSFWADEAGAPQEPLRSAKEYESYLARLRDTPRFFADEEANMRAGEARGFTPPQVTLNGRDRSIAAVAEAKSPEDTSYWKPFLTMPSSIAAPEQQRLRAEGREVIASAIVPAYKQLLHFWKEEYFPRTTRVIAAEALPDGKAYYQSHILAYATVTLTPEQIHQIGLDEMAAIHREMLLTMQEANFKGDLPAFLAFLRTDPEFYAKTPDELLMRAALIAKEFDGVASRYFGYEPRNRFGIIPVPAAIAPFYTSARGGRSVYLVNTYDLPSRGLYSLPALTLHESAPGHSWQLSIAAEHKDSQSSATPISLPMARDGRCTANASAPRWACTTRRTSGSAC